MGIVKRSDKISFWGVKKASAVTFNRMKGFTEILLGTSRIRSVIVCQIKMRNSKVKCRCQHIYHIVIIISAAEVMPQSQRKCRQLQSAFSASVIFHVFVSFLICCIQS